MNARQPQRDDIERFLNPRYLDLYEVLDAVEKEIALAENLFRSPILELRTCSPDRRKLAITISGGGNGIYLRKCHCPPPGLLRGRKRRASPCIYSDKEVADLIAAAQGLSGR